MSVEAAVLVVGAAIVRGRECLAAKRGSQMKLAGKWEFPGGKVEAGESPREALVREIREELGIDIVVGESLAAGEVVEAGVGGSAVVLEVYRAQHVSGEPVAHEHETWGWFDAEALCTLDWAPADLPALAIVLELLR